MNMHIVNKWVTNEGHPRARTSLRTYPETFRERDREETTVMWATFRHIQLNELYNVFIKQTGIKQPNLICTIT